MKALVREAMAGVESLASGAYGQGAGSAAMRKMTHWVNRSNPVIMNNVARIGMGAGAAISARAGYVDARRGEYGKAALWTALGGAAAYGAVSARNTQSNIRSAISLGRKTFFKNAAGTMQSGGDIAANNVAKTLQMSAQRTLQMPRNSVTASAASEVTQKFRFGDLAGKVAYAKHSARSAWSDIKGIPGRIRFNRAQGYRF